MDTPPLSRPFRFAVQGGPFGDAAAMREHAVKVEDLGYTELFTSDHIGAPGSGGRRGGAFVTDPFVPLMIAAESTTRLRLGPLVLNTQFYNPALLARTVATADRLCGGRLVLGLGTGYSAAEHDSIGAPIRPPGPRVSRFEEFLTVLRALLDEHSVEFSGDYESVHIDDIGVSPKQAHVPFLIGGHGRRVVGLAGEHADVFQYTGLTHGLDGAPSAGGFAFADVEKRSTWLTESAGPRDPFIERSALVQFTALGPEAPSSTELADRFELDEATIEKSPFILVGTLGQIVDKIGYLKESLGITHYVIRDAEGFAPVVEALADR
ncbi:MAG: LLM class flavin-dependent oxidoreductase [Acidimicrobiia bacterium]